LHLAEYLMKYHKYGNLFTVHDLAQRDWALRVFLSSFSAYLIRVNKNMKRCIECGSNFDSPDWQCPSCDFEPEMVGKWPTFATDMIEEGPEEFDEAIYARMTACEHHSFYSRARLKLIRWCLTKFFLQSGNFYDFSAGTGVVLEAVRSIKPDIQLYASDLAVDSLAWVDTRLGGKITLFHTDASHIPFADHFDVLGAFDVVEHIDDDVGAMKDLFRTVKPGGGIMLTVPQHMSLWSPLDEEAGHKRRYIGHELARKVREAGFDVVLDTSFLAILYPLQYISRRFLTRIQSRQSFETEHSLPGPLNTLLGMILSLELLLIKGGARFPFGGIRIVAAYKPKIAS